MGAKDANFITAPEDQKKVFKYVLEDIRQLNKMIHEGKLDRSVARIGAEQELAIVDAGYRPAAIISRLLEEADDDHFTTELAKFILEINIDPEELQGDCFSKMKSTLEKLNRKALKACEKLGNYKLLMTGILPTIRPMDLELDNLTDNERSRGMIEAMKWLKRDEYSIRINGIDELSTTDFSNMFESCNTSFQVHYQVNPADFVDRFNYAQLIAAPVLAACTNSPLLFGKRLWHETRIALFQQAVDTRDNTKHLSEAFLRVPFGDEWVSESITEIFESDLSKFKIFLQHPNPDNTREAVENDQIPDLVNLQTFNSTVFRWTRPCYGVLDGKPHLRIENRMIPAGPTIEDEIANTAFWTGLMHGMPKEYHALAEKMPFEEAKINALKAARYGLETQFKWIDNEKIKAVDLIIDKLIPMAGKGLEAAEVNKEEIDHYLSIVRTRVEKGRTGSKWILNTWSRFEDLHTADARSMAITASMLKNQQEGQPVHNWKAVQWKDLSYQLFTSVGQIMSTDLYCLGEQDIIDQAVFSMIKKGYTHIPVANSEGSIKGILSASDVIEKMVIHGQSTGTAPLIVADVMRPDPVTVDPSTSARKAIAAIKKNDVKCLPVIHKGKLAGLVTEFDFMQVAEFFLEQKKQNTNGKD